MRLTKEQIDTFRGKWAGKDTVLSVLCDMADELLKADHVLKVNTDSLRALLLEVRRDRDEWKANFEELSRELNAQHGKYRHEVIDDNICDLRSICETLAKRIAALEGFNDIPSPFTPSSFWRASTKSMSHDERKGQRRKIVASAVGVLRRNYATGLWKSERREADRRHFDASRGFVFDGIERRRHWVADRRQQDPDCILARREDNRRQGAKDRRIVMAARR